MNSELLQIYISGNATETEKQRVTEWMQESPENMREYMAQRKLHDIALWRTEPVKTENKQLKKHFTLRTLWIETAKIAAIFAVVLLGTYYWSEKHQAEQSESLQSIHVPAGQRAELMLADGTKVWLNSLSTLTFPGHFNGDIRNVKLDGEGYFAVTKNEKQPFIVEVGDIEVKVYGTQFNISTQNKDNIETVLVSGSVSIRHHDQETHLNPSQKAAYTSSGKLTIEEVDVLPYITWKDGNFMFQNESLESVMNKLARWYDLDVFYLNEQTKNIHLSGMMTRYKEVSELFHYFEKISTARFIIKGRTVTVK